MTREVNRTRGLISYQTHASTIHHTNQKATSCADFCAPVSVHILIQLVVPVIAVEGPGQDALELRMREQAYAVGGPVHTVP